MSYKQGSIEYEVLFNGFDYILYIADHVSIGLCVMSLFFVHDKLHSNANGHSNYTAATPTTACTDYGNGYSDDSADGNAHAHVDTSTYIDAYTDTYGEAHSYRNARADTDTNAETHSIISAWTREPRK